jgi:hypothetical protein
VQYIWLLFQSWYRNWGCDSGLWIVPRPPLDYVKITPVVRWAETAHPLPSGVKTWQSLHNNDPVVKWADTAHLLPSGVKTWQSLHNIGPVVKWADTAHPLPWETKSWQYTNNINNFVRWAHSFLSGRRNPGSLSINIDPDMRCAETANLLQLGAKSWQFLHIISVVVKTGRSLHSKFKKWNLLQKSANISFLCSFLIS